MLTLSAAYAIPLVFILWVWLRSEIGISIKITMTLLLPLFYWLHWQALQDQQGWPADHQLPEKFELISADVVEPTLKNNHQGKIFLWVRPDLKRHTDPRSYALPYTRKLHKLLFTTKERIAAGRRQIGILRSDKTHSSGARIGHGLKLEFINKPRNSLPPK